MKSEYSRQITPLSESDCLGVFDWNLSKFDFPIHFHPEYELNFLHKANGAKRIVGDHISQIGEFELVLVGPNLIHYWEQGSCSNRNIHQITILFHRELFHESILNRQTMHSFKLMLEMAHRGIAFSSETIRYLRPRLEQLKQRKGHAAFLGLLDILFELAASANQEILSSAGTGHDDTGLDNRIKQVKEYIFRHYREKIKTEDMAKKINTSPVTFNRFMKRNTGRSFIDFVNDFRIGYACRLLMETQKGISAVASECGFNNQANFNRIFKKKKGYSPREFRKNYANIKADL